MDRPATMKALVKERPGASYVYKDVPVPVPEGEELLVKVGKVALCGSDIALYQWGEGIYRGRGSRTLYLFLVFSPSLPRPSSPTPSTSGTEDRQHPFHAGARDGGRGVYQEEAYV